MREDEDPIRVIYDASYRRLVGQLYAVCGNRGDAEDAVQEAFLQAVYHRRRFLEMDRPEAGHPGPSRPLARHDGPAHR